MEHWFWLQYDINLATYQNMQRVHEADGTFDPAVNTYRELLSIISGNETGGGHVAGTVSVRGADQDQIVHSAPDKITTDRADSRGQRVTSDTDSFLDRETKRSRSGSREMHRTGDGSRNYVRDGDGSQEIVSRQTDQHRITTRSGGQTSTDDVNDAIRSASAEKAAPMTAINLSRESGAAGPAADLTGYADVANGALGRQNWTSASAYRESGQQSGSSGVHKITYDDDTSDERSYGDADKNRETRQLQRSQETGTDITETETYDGYADTERQSGSEQHDRTENPYTDTLHEEAEHSFGPVTVTHTKGTETGTSEDTTSHKSSASEDWTRHTGRDNLTPQEAFRQALNYLADYRHPIHWLIDQLDHCFIPTIDAEV